jgi:hypothetical protein
VISTAGQFQYLTFVPGSADESQPWPVQCGPAQTRDGPCLVGPSPALTITDADPISNPSIRCPGVRRSRYTLTASAGTGATIRSASFYLDRYLASAFQPGDALYMTRTGCGGIGISLLRGTRLVFAVGAVTAVPLAGDIDVAVPSDLLRDAASIFQKRDPNFEFPEWPVELRVGQDSSIVYRARLELGNYHVWVEHGYYPGMPGRDMCLAITLMGAAGPFVATASAQLLDHTPLEMRRGE